MKANPLKKYLAEGLLIVFSVLFALFINKLSDDYKTRKQKVIALQSIKSELYRNAAIVADWRKKHAKVLGRLDSILQGKNDSLKAKLQGTDFLDFGMLTNEQSLIDATLTDTAWEAAKSTEIISEFDFESVQNITQAYKVQNILMEKTVTGMVGLFFDPVILDNQNLEMTLIQFNLRFGELVGQERTLEQLYEDAIQSIP